MPSAGQLIVASTPTPVGTPVTIVNTAGALGGPSDVTFRRPVPPPAVSHAADLATVMWSANAIVVPVPTDLPVRPGATETWQIIITNDAGTTFDPLAIQVVTTAPTSAKVLTAGGGPANLEAPVTVVPVGGVFGTATLRSGTVTLSLGADSFDADPARVVWTSVAVTFTVPRDLPTSPAPQAWQVVVQPKGWAPCGPYPLDVLAVPAVLFVPPTSVAERRIDVVATGAGHRAVVRFYDGTGRHVAHNVPPARRTLTGLAVQMPTLREVMDSGTTQFDTNQLTMRLRVTVYDPDSGRETPQSDAFSTVMVAPAPAVGPVKSAGTQGTLILGEGGRPAELGDQMSLEWIGAPGRGRVTFHPLDIAQLDRLAELRLAVARMLDPTDPDLALVPGSALVEGLSELRAAGAPPKTVVAWGEERIEVEVPDAWDSGFVLVWRDDLPSPAIVIPEVPIPDLCRPGALQSALSDLLALDAPTEIGPGAPFDVRSIPVAAPVPGSLGEQLLAALGQPGRSLDFVCRMVGAPVAGPALPPPGAPVAVPVALNPANPTATLLSGLRIRPQLVSMEAGPQAGVNSVTVSLEAVLQGLCADPLQVVVDTLKIIQLPVRLPTLVATFDRRKADPASADAWGYPALVFVNPGTGLVAGAADRSVGEVALGQAKTSVTTPLTAVSAALKAANAVFPGIVPAEDIEWLPYFIDRLARCPVSELVVTAEQSRDRLNYNPWWWNRISSLFMVGVGDGVSSPRLILYEGDDRTSHQFHVRMPPGHVVASYWTLHESAFLPDFGSPPVVPAPGPDQEGRAANYPRHWPSGQRFFGDVVKSFEWG